MKPISWDVAPVWSVTPWSNAIPLWGQAVKLLADNIRATKGERP